MSASDPRIQFGLGKRTKIESLEITWPSGKVDRLTNVPIDQIIAVKEGTGIVPHPFPKVPEAGVGRQTSGVSKTGVSENWQPKTGN
jgi:hypothetical protein